jgi:hypothetical protein
MNKLKLNLEITFTEDARVTDKDKEIIIENVITALRQQVNSGMGVAPEHKDYITETVDVRLANGFGTTWDLKNDCKV